ncbi:DNA helicase-2 / ATP-dependent DNA helicase PcrA [Parafrankia irregularis]|uniref:DNA 3'-5' helicase n=1 Tax=Parafrankia irregularis TaxID=795642 RepID=A0A0S4QTA7_9ACTN|nr:MULTISPECIES: ATP-dependent DNA helicase UvrD2 [Parafrankia]MBE3205189.1 ATP-dependent DNA helicase UvrD2 [Parafrankia sp. CH37]CUU58855.1 DNA helicase-2 / ATP-dependent DNA helicase PcrA [Parafrankia irregularis]
MEPGAGLDPEQLAAVLAPIGPVCILAGAGTGKTRTITHRIAHLVTQREVGAGQILAVTFTNRAAAELRGRLRLMGADGVQARTFHAAALRHLSYFWPKVAGVALPRLEKSRVPLLVRAANRARLRPDRAELRDLVAEVEWAKSMMVAPADYVHAAAEHGREGSYAPDVVARLYEAYEDVKGEAGVLDFDDLLLLTAAVIEEHSWVAAELRSRYRHFVVDEYQDVNPLQQRVLDAWLGDRDSLCVVGDEHQTIYSFTGASARHLLDFPRRFPTATVVRLVRDYRSTPQVVALANGLLDGAPPAAASAGSAASSGSTGSAAAPAGPRGRLVAMRPAGPAPTWLEADSEPEEAAGVARRIRGLLATGVAASDIAVLYRINAQSEAYETALARADIPYLLRGGEKFFERPEVTAAVRMLRAAVRSAEPDRPGGLGDAVADGLGALGWQPGAAPAGRGADRERWENLAALHRLAVDLEAARPDADLEAFVADLAERAAHQHTPTVQGVTLASLHAAKGLEWDAVFLVGLVEGTLPIVHAQSDEQIAEERRLLYVGITRARVHLALSWSLARAEGARRSRRPSRFLDDLRRAAATAGGTRGSSRTAATRASGDAAVSGSGHGAGHGSAAAGERRGGGESVGGGTGRPRGRQSVQCHVCGRSLAGARARIGRCETCPGQVDAELFERLCAWRAQRAKEQGAPAFVVLTDATLRLIAQRRPATVADLVALPGIGQSKLDRYGEDVLALVSDTASRGSRH